MTGFSASELVNHDLSHALLGTWNTWTKPRPCTRPVLAGLAPEEGFELTFMRKNRERFEALVYEAKLIDGNGRHTGWMASVLDITERKRAEELARQQQEQLQVHRPPGDPGRNGLHPGARTEPATGGHCQLQHRLP